MFLKSLKITNGSEVIRDIPFHKGINLIIDETKTEDKRDSGNSVGKTTVLRLIDFCLGGSGKNIYQDTEFKNTNNVRVEEFLKQNDLIITLILKEDLEDIDSNEIEISRNFLARGEKIQKINNESYNNPKEFEQKLKALIFGSTADKPTFRQIIAKNIRDEKNRLANTVKILHPTTTPEEYEALYLFWLGIDSDSADRKHRLSLDRKIEENHQRKLRTEWTLPQLTHFLLVVNSRINELEVKKANFNLNDNFNEELSALNQTKSELNQLSSEVSRLEIRRELILESKEYLEKDLAEIDTQRIKKLYNEAKALVPSLQKSFEETLSFHNQMISEKVKYITEELPALETELSSIKRKVDALLIEEKRLTEKLRKTGVVEELDLIISELNKSYEKKGKFEDRKELWENSNNKVKSIDKELVGINEGINSKDELIQTRIAEFNKYFAELSNRLYGEQFVLSPDKNEKGYELRIDSISGNLGTGKKKGQIAAFDLAYIQFADALNIDCLHFILHDQLEAVHDNQISSLIEIVSQVNCQYVLPILRDKLPGDIYTEQYEVLSLSQTDKLFALR